MIQQICVLYMTREDAVLGLPKLVKNGKWLPLWLLAKLMICRLFIVVFAFDTFLKKICELGCAVTSFAMFPWKETADRQLDLKS